MLGVILEFFQKTPASPVLPHMNADDLARMTPEQYADWVNERLAGELRRRREEQGKKPYELIVPG